MPGIVYEMTVEIKIGNIHPAGGMPFFCEAGAMGHLVPQTCVEIGDCLLCSFIRSCPTPAAEVVKEGSRRAYPP